MKPLDECLLRLVGCGELDEEDLQLLHQNIVEDPLSEEVFSISPARTADALRERLDFFYKTTHLLPECNLEVCGQRVRAKILLRELWRFYAPLCLLLVRFMRNNSRPRTLIGLAGPPGSGKSIMAALLAELINHYLREEGEPGLVCSQDAFHLPNKKLEEEVEVSGGENRTLRWEKGSPRTFDVEAFVKALHRIAAGEQLRIPVYDRGLHDPVPDALPVKEGHRLVFVDGNYLLLDRGPWYAVAPLLDLKCFLLVPLRVLRGALIVRHGRGGRTTDDAKRHFEEVDMPNYQVVMQTMEFADLILKRDALQRLVDIQWNDQAVTEVTSELVEPEETEAIDQGESL